MPRAVTSTALSFSIYFMYFLGTKEFRAPKQNIKGNVPRAKKSIISAPLTAFPDDIAKSHMAYIVPQGMKPVSAPMIRGLPETQPLVFFGKRQKPCPVGMIAPSPGISPHIFMPIKSTASPMTQKSIDLVSPS